MNKAVFLDRDGIIIKERGEYNYKEDHIQIVEGIVEALKKLQDKGYLLIVITNQGGIGKGLYTHARLREIHRDLKSFFASYGIKIMDFYYCPHHPVTSACLCRKPDSLMLEKAMARHNIDPEASVFIGDNQRDIDAGVKAGVPTILVPGNADLNDYIGKL